MFRKNTLLRAMIAAGLTTGLVACGGGSSSESTPPQNTSVTAIDGYLANADIYIDTNENGILDTAEKGSKVGSTDENGVLTVSAEAFEGLLLVEAVAGQTIDSDSGPVSETFVLSAPKNSRYLTPFTHLAQSTGQTLADIANDLGLPESVISGDYISAQNDTSSETADSAKIAHAVARFIVQEIKKQTDIQTVSSNLIAAKSKVVERIEAGEDASFIEVELESDGTIVDAPATKLAFSNGELQDTLWTMFRFDDAGDNEQMFLRLGTTNAENGMCIVNERLSFVNQDPTITAPDAGTCQDGTFEVTDNGGLKLSFVEDNEVVEFTVLFRNNQTDGESSVQSYLAVSNNGELFWMDNNSSLQDAGDYTITENNTRYLFGDDNGDTNSIEYYTGERQFTINDFKIYTVNGQGMELNFGDILFGNIGAASFETTFDSVPAYLDLNQFSAGDDDILVVRENPSTENYKHYHFIYRSSGDLELMLDYKPDNNSENLYLQSPNKALIEKIATEVKARNTGTQGDS